MIKSAVNSSGPLPPDEKFSQLVSALRELQELRKADSEWVAEVLSNRLGNGTSTIDRALPVGTQLYRHAQPAPVVHGEVASAIEELKRTLVDCNRYNYCSDAIARVESACRAAMLAATQQSSGSEPDTVPGKWVPVSERMPEAEGHYLVWANASRIDGYCDHLAIATYQGGEWSNEFNWLVNHWMPLPAAPQEP
ncbi:TPA: DUF551 domain-containing protein [Escherichia coli]